MTYFNTDFDPLLILEAHTAQLGLLITNINELARAFNTNADKLDELEKVIQQQSKQSLIKKINQLIELAMQQDEQLQELHSRIRLLEVARQYGENK